MNRRNLILGTLSLTAGSARATNAPAQTWKRSTSILTPPNSPRDVEAFYWNSYSGACRIAGVTVPLQPAGAWITIDLTTLDIPANANAVQLANLMVITDGANSGDVDLAVAFQASGAGGDPLKYVEQAVAIGSADGARTNATVVCPLGAGRFDVSISRGIGGSEFPAGPLAAQYPDGACYAIWLLVQAVFLP